MNADKSHILDEIKRTAEDNGGKPLGTARFEAETGIRTHDWLGKHWARWGDALIEAGYAPNELTKAYNDATVIQSLIGVIRELQRFPTYAELKLKSNQQSDFPCVDVFRRLGNKQRLIAKTLEFCSEATGFEDVQAICDPLLEKQVAATASSPNPSLDDVGFVYLLKSGRYWKIGQTSSVGRREYELSIQLPEAATMVHSIKTDDPLGIEGYWHRRFADKRLNGEWFNLDAKDIAAFKRRKFM